MSAQKLLLIDANNIGHRANMAQTLRDKNGMETQAVFGFLTMLYGASLRFPNHKPIVLWDDKAQWRFDLFPMYKGNRGSEDKKILEKKESYKNQVPYIKEALIRLGVTQVYSDGNEADDIAGFMHRWALSSPKRKIVMMTSDKDWLQLFCQEKIEWFCSMTNQHCRTNIDAQVITGFENIDQFLEFKCLIGDTSDNICGIGGGMGKETAKELLERFVSVEAFLSMFDMDSKTSIAGFKSTLPKTLLAFGNNDRPKPSAKWGEMLPMREAYDRNMKLMKLDGARIKSPADLKIIRSNVDISDFEDFCASLDLYSIIKNMNNWDMTFNRAAKL